MTATRLINRQYRRIQKLKFVLKKGGENAGMQILFDLFTHPPFPGTQIYFSQQIVVVNVTNIKINQPVYFLATVNIMEKIIALTV